MFTGVFFKKVDSLKSLEEITNTIPSIFNKEIRNGYLLSSSKELLYNRKVKISKCITSDGLNKIIIEYNFSPNILSWLLGICLFPFGFLIFIITSNSKNDFEDEISSRLS